MQTRTNRIDAATETSAVDLLTRRRSLRGMALLTLVVGIVLLAQIEPAHAACSAGRQVLVGHVPDVFLTAGVTTTKTVTYTYRNIGGSWTDCGIYAQSTLTGVAVVNSYGYNGREAFPPEITGVGPATFTGAFKTWSFAIKALSTAPAASGVIKLFVNNACDVCVPSLVLIGRINVYVTVSAYSTAFTVTATASNTTGHVLYINHSATNGKASARLVVTPNWNPGCKPGVYNNHATGVYYTGSRWAIYNEDLAAIAIGSSFNVRVGGPASVDHRATSANTSANYTLIDDSIANDNPHALVLVTHAWNPGGAASGTYNNHTLGVWYSATHKRWAIFNQDRVAMPVGAGFNVIVMGYRSEVPSGMVAAGPLDGAGGVLVHTATASNMPLAPGRHFTWLDSPLLNGNACAIIVVTPTYNPPGSSGVYNDHPYGVRFDALTGRWVIFNQDLEDIPLGAAFNVLVPRPVPAC